SITEEPSTSSTTTTGTTEEPSTSSTTTTNTTKKPSTSATADTISNDLQKVTLVSSSKQTSSDKKINGTGNKNKSLPQTGEMSDKIASIVGIAFLIGAVVSLVILRKNKRTKD
ncbi:LPXTG cell wall anchor domain-containing protein, partial [Liquorilactobacillus aquaticus]